MTARVPCLWHRPPSDWKARLDRVIEASPPGGRVFFRADDAGVPGRSFHRLMEIFTRHQAPLCLAVVPAWITPVRWAGISSSCAHVGALWCWHQHGYRHVNHEPMGKKQEFGPSRPDQAVHSDLDRGRRKLENILGPAFFPAFTPPWNRCDVRTAEHLADLGFVVLSRTSQAASPVSGLLELGVDVDLHTRKNQDAASDWARLWTELSRGLSRPVCGIMIHHQRANAGAFAFLDALVQGLARRRPGKLVHFQHLADEILS